MFIHFIDLIYFRWWKTSLFIPVFGPSNHCLVLVSLYYNCMLTTLVCIEVTLSCQQVAKCDVVTRSVTQEFFRALTRVKQIHEDVKVLLRTNQQTAGYEMNHSKPQSANQSLCQPFITLYNLPLSNLPLYTSRHLDKHDCLHFTFI